METVKVDIQKLQLLNDRIAQTIEALNQVRMSAHGIQHTGSPYGQYMPQGVSQFSPYGVNPYQQQSPYQVAQSPYPSPYALPFPSPFFAGIQHTTTQPYPTTPYATPFTTPFTTPFATSPFTTSPWQTPGLSHTTAPVATTLGAWTMPYVGNGLSHSPWDPSWGVRVAQSFPFAQSPYPVTIS